MTRFITRLHEIAAEFAQQPGLGVEATRHAVRVHRDAVRELLVEPRRPHHERGGAEIGEPEIGCDDGGDARRVGG